MDLSNISKAFSLSADQDSQNLATIGTIEPKLGYTTFAFELASAGGSAVALDQFVLQIQAHPDAAFVTCVSNWATTNTMYLFGSATLNTLAHGSAAFAFVRTGPIWAARFQSAQAGVTASPVTVTVRGAMSAFVT